jgi:hypothetical protein
MAADRYKAAKSFTERKSAVAALKQITGRFAKPAAPLLAKAAAEVAAEEKKRAQLLAAGKIPPDVYKLVNRKSGKVLDVEGRSKEDGHKLDQWGYSGANNEKWKVVPQEDGSYQIICVDSGKALNVPQAQSGDGIALAQANPARTPSQLWKIEKVDGNFYKITAQSSGKALAIGGDPAKDGSPIIQTAYTGAPEQQWKLDLP